MKIALCISGQPRNVTRGIPNILEHLNFDFDVFHHSWWDNKSSTSLFTKSNAAKINDIVSEPVDNNWISMMYENFNIKKLQLEAQVPFNVPQILEDRKAYYANSFNIYSSLYSIYKCNELKKEYEKQNNFIYDIVIRTRLDFGFSECININNFDGKVIYVPNDFGYTRYGFNDQFAIGSSPNMNIYSEAFNNIKTILDSGYKDPMGHEQIIQKHLENNNIQFILKDFKNFLWRHENNKSRIHSLKK
tara:strand:+ start:6079 stop:6816 length:738 start_codon:yes stop_codon:yes gene_type:complete